MATPRDPSTFSFDAAAKTVTFSAPIPSYQAQIVSILNVTRQAWLYVPARTGGTWSSPVLTLAASTVGHANSDVLQIYVDDGSDSATVTIGASVEVSNDAGNPLPVSPNISRGGGTLDANTQRVTMATDGPTVSSLTSIDSKSLALPTADAQTSVATSTTTVQLLAARTTRKRLLIFNPSGGSALSIGNATPVTSANTFVTIPAGNGLFLDQADFTGVAGAWYGLLASGTSTAQVRESY